jgi:autotransporter-associated beta strand protein
MKTRAVVITRSSVNEYATSRHESHRSKLFCLSILAALTTATSSFAASQTWTNAPVDNSWTNGANWVGKAVPGASNTTTSTDVATFNTPIPGSGIGGAGNPITNGFLSGIRSILFDTVNCGAYVFGHNLADNYLEVVQTGNLTINSTVVNPVVFNEAISFRGPNSQNYSYFITNNGVSPTATLFIAALTNNGNSTTRPFSITLAGSNTGTNTIAHIDDRTTGTVNGAITIDVFGPSKWIFSGPNDLPQKTSASIPAHVFVNSGTLEVQDPGSLGTISVGNLRVLNGGTLQIDNVTPANAGISLFNGGTIRMNGTGLVNGVTVSTAASTSATLATTSSTDLMTVGVGQNSLTGGGADTVLHVAGPGTVELTQLANYAGNWSADAGVLKIDGASMLGTGLNLNIGAGGTFNMTNIGATTYAPDTAGISGSGTGTIVGTTAATILADPAGTLDLSAPVKNILLNFTPTSFSGDTTHPALYIAQGILAIGGNTFTVNNASSTPLGPGTYTLIQQASGSVTSGGNFAVNVTGKGLASPGGGAINVGSIQVSGGNVNLVVVTYTPKNLVWQGGNPNNNWDINTDANFLNGASPSVFNDYDNVTFNSVGAANSTVTPVGTLAPSTITVDTSGGNYTFGVGGSISGTTGLLKTGNGTLLIQNANNYLGTTTISGGSIELLSSSGLPTTSDVVVNSPGTLDAGVGGNIGGLSGNGTLDNVSNFGGNPVMSVGNDNVGGTFSGIIRNSTGTLGLTKNGNGLLKLTGANTYSGPTTLNAGSLVVGNPSALGISVVTVNAGTLDLGGNSVTMASLAGAGGTITNTSGTVVTNVLTITNGNSFNGVIAENSSGAKLQVVVLGNAEERLNGANTYSGGTIVGESATVGTQSGGSLGTGSITLSNGTTLFLHQFGGTACTVGNALIIPDNSSISNNSTSLGNFVNGDVFGGPTATFTVMGGNGITMGAATNQFRNFSGTVIAQSTIRWGPGAGVVGGGDNTTFIIPPGGQMQHRATGAVSLGYLGGSGNINGPQNSSGYCTFIIGAKGLDDNFEGGIVNSNNIVKTGPARLILDGVNITTNTDNLTFTNYLFTNVITSFGSTTISNGVLGLVVPNNLTYSTNLILAGANAVLDATRMGYVSNQVDNTQTVTNQLLVTNGVIELISQQTNSGFGTIWGHLVADAGSAVNPGLPTGTLTVTNGIELNGATVNISLDRTNAQNSGELAAAGASSITITGGTLNVTNVGPDLGTGDVFQLFNKPVSGFATVNLPLANAANTITYSIQNNLNIDGSIKVLSGLNYNPTNINFSVSGGILHLSWPADHIGWLLTVQTNHLTNGLSANHSDWGVIAGSGGMTSTNITIDHTKPTTFYRLVSP